MALAHFLIGLFIITGFNAGVLAGIAFFLFVYQNSSGPIAYQYATETCCDIGLGICILVLYFTILVLSLSTEPLMDSKLQPQGVFFLFAILSVIAFIFLYFYLGETMHLSKSEKKNLYVPGGEWGRKLKQDEVPYSPFVTQQRKNGAKYDPVRVGDVNRSTTTSVPTFRSADDPAYATSR